MLIPGWSVRTLQCGDAGSEGRCSQRTLHHRGPGTRWQSDEAVSGLWTMVFTDQTLPTQETTCLHQGSSDATCLQSSISMIRLLWMVDQDSWWVEDCLETRTWHQWSSMMWEQVHLDMTHLWYDTLVPGQWITLPQLRTGRRGHSMMVESGRLMVVGGMDQQDYYLQDMEIFNGERWK